MTDADLMEISLRARLAQAQNKDVIGMFTRGRTVLVGRFMVSSNRDNVVFAGINGEPFFWHKSHREPLSRPDPPPRARDIECTDDELAKELLARLRTDQVLDDLMRIE